MKKILAAALALAVTLTSVTAFGAGITKQIDSQTSEYSNDFNTTKGEIMADPMLYVQQGENITMDNGKVTVGNETWIAIGTGGMLGPVPYKASADIQSIQRREEGNTNHAVAVGVRAEVITNLFIDTGLWFMVYGNEATVLVVHHEPEITISLPVDFRQERKIYIEDDITEVRAYADDDSGQKVLIARVDVSGTDAIVYDYTGAQKGTIPNHGLQTSGYFKIMPHYCAATIDNYAYTMHVNNKENVTSAYEPTNAADFSLQQGYGLEISNDPEFSGFVASMKENGFAVYQKLDFGDGKNKTAGIKFRASATGGSGLLKIVLDSPDGEVLGEIPFNGTDRADVWYEQWAPLMPASGVHDVYIYCIGRPLRMSSFWFTKDSPYDEQNKTYKPVPDSQIRDMWSDTWVATDMLGRKILTGDDEGVGEPNENEVGIFYWTWRDSFTVHPATNVTAMFKQYPEAQFDRNHPVWPVGSSMNHWAEPLYGYYANSDQYVVRKHAELLANAGIDFILTDCTNGSWLWEEGLLAVLEGFRQAREDGIDAPKVAVMMNFGADVPTTNYMLRSLYNLIYARGEYSDLWYYVDGKPLVMAYPDWLQSGPTTLDQQIYDDIKNFFTFRPGQPSYFTGPTRSDHWGWLEIAPQHQFGKKAGQQAEMMCVGVAQNANKSKGLTAMNDPDDPTFGRSYTSKDGHSKETEGSYVYGYNFQEQWDNAIAANPKRVFITGWNEWTAGGNMDKTGRYVEFVDQFSPERSRDIEMDTTYIKDVYYLQMVSNIRKYKGARKAPVASAEKTITLGGDASQWDDVLPNYCDDKGDTIHRDSAGYKGTYYKNDTGRNDIINAKVARDAENVYFYVETAEAISPQTDKAWMNIYINTDRKADTGWEGFDIVINRQKAGSVEKNTGGFNWESVGDCEFTVSGNRLEVKVPKALLGISGSDFEFEFKISDNMQKADIMDFYVNGDSAPIGRFNYLYKTK